jgi:type IV fimbrial biogenesis protein FimT
MRDMDGFTLVELMVVTVVAATLLSIGLPAYSHLRERVAVRSASHALTASLSLARTLAVTRRTPVSICPTRDGRTCAHATDWDDGWMVFLDPARRGQPASADHVIARDPGRSDLSMRSTGGRRLVRYQPDGRAWGSNVTLRLCSRHEGEVLARVVVNNVGRVRVDHEAAGACS